jgi:hypothetical protein
MNKKIYYHFLSFENAKKALKNDRIKISLINELNDPFELLPYLRYREYKKRQKYHDIRKTISKKYGLLCFSGNWEESLLWGHYADKHRGIALGFEILKDEVFPICYRGELKRVEFELKNNDSKNEKLFLDLARVKYERWSYENEYRIIISLGDCKKVRVSDRCKGKRVCRFLKFQERLKIKEIILGCKLNRRYYEEIKNLAKKHNAKVIPTREGWEGYNIRKDGTKEKEFKILRSV